MYELEYRIQTDCRKGLYRVIIKAIVPPALEIHDPDVAQNQRCLVKIQQIEKKILPKLKWIAQFSKAILQKFLFSYFWLLL